MSPKKVIGGVDRCVETKVLITQLFFFKVNLEGNPDV